MNNKGDNLKNGNYIIENKEELLHKRKSRKRLRYLMLLVIIMVSTLITLCIKLPYFNITSIQITGNMNASKVEIYKTAKTHLGSNIFYDSFNDSKKQIMKNPYIESVKVNKVLPNKLTIKVHEKVAVFYGKQNNNYYILDNNGILLEKRTNIKNMNLIKLVGFNYEKGEVGKLIALKDDRKIDSIKKITNIINEYRQTTKSNNITMVDVSNVLDIKIFTGNMCIKFGAIEDIKNKFNKAINIITQLKYQNANGYVDVSSTGNPVVFIKK